mmetsp:Transcript_35513/g.64000  ORF Transcript_35513/g.64000 Transcript_35513/m.64000 type:complete len:252 (+) Transcript_35513:1021-1776(+)
MDIVLSSNVHCAYAMSFSRGIRIPGAITPWSAASKWIEVKMGCTSIITLLVSRKTKSRSTITLTRPNIPNSPPTTSFGKVTGWKNSTDWSRGRSFCWLVCWLLCRLICRIFRWSLGWSFCWIVSWLLSRLIGRRFRWIGSCRLIGGRFRRIGSCRLIRWGLGGAVRWLGSWSLSRLIGRRFCWIGSCWLISGRFRWRTRWSFSRRKRWFWRRSFRGRPGGLIGRLAGRSFCGTCRWWGRRSSRRGKCWVRW